MQRWGHNMIPKAKVLKHPVMPAVTPKKAVAKVALKKPVVKRVVKAKKKAVAKKK